MQAANKDQIRKEILNKRDSMDPKQALEQELLVCEKAKRLVLSNISSINPASNVIGIYKPIGSELNIKSLATSLQNDGFTLAYPVVKGLRGMDFYSLNDYSFEEAVDILPHPLKNVDFDTFPGKPISALNMTVIVVPGVGFSRTRYRMGYGKGFYDTYLSRQRIEAKNMHNCYSLGVGFDIQLLDEIPTESHDFQLDAVLTSSETLF